MIEQRKLDVLRRFFPVTTGSQAVHTLLRLPDSISFCDNWSKPRMVAVTRNDDLVLAGDAEANGWIDFVGSLDFSGFIQASETFLLGLKQIDPEIKIWPRVSFVLETPLKDIPYPSNAQVRKISPGDAAVLEKISAAWLWKYWSDTEDFCRTGTAFVTVSNGQTVSVSSIFSQSNRYVDIAVATHPEFRGEGYAMAAAHTLCREIVSQGKQPVWNTSTGNAASRAMPLKLGFREIPAEPFFVMRRDLPN
jgi:RimJ/RimL family protein N-acetyltransferase